jgi:predicted DNA-binding protein
MAGPLECRVRRRQTSIHLPVNLHQRVRKYAFDQEVTLSAVMVDAIEAWLDAREG